MKKYSAMMLACVLLVVAGAAAAAVTYRVVTRETALRQAPRFFAPVVAQVAYSEALQGLERRGDWIKVNHRGRQGWLHMSAVQQQSVSWAKLAGGRAEETSRDEVALAGKGFTPEVEKAFRSRNPVMRYELVDRLEALQITEEQLQTFLQAGKLKEPEVGL